MSHPFTPIKTAAISWCDGLSYSSNLDDLYCSVFLKGNQLIQRWQALPIDKPSQFVIAETSFGCGLNLMLTCYFWEKYAPPLASLHYISAEKEPLTRDDLARCLAIWPELDQQTQSLLSVYPVLTPGFHRLNVGPGNIHLTLMLGDALTSFQSLLVCGDLVLESSLREWFVDAWFINGFAPACEELYSTISQLSTLNTTLATDCTSSAVMSSLQTAGFQVQQPLESIDHSPPSNLVDTENHHRKQGGVIAKWVEYPFKRTLRHTPWHVAPKIRVPEDKHAIVLGAGLAGCCTADALARRGWRVTLVDAAEDVGCGASGNQQAVLYPKLSSYKSPLTEYMLSAFLFAKQFYGQWLSTHAIGELNGILQLPSHQHDAKAQKSLQDWLAYYPELGRLVDAEQASHLTGVHLQSGGLFVPAAGWIDPKAVCRLLIQTPGITWVPHHLVSALAYENGNWSIGEHHASVLVIANGYQASQFKETAHLPLKAMQGQMTYLASNAESICLRIPLCGEGHILPARRGLHALGATYNPNVTHSDCSIGDDKLNLDKLKAMPGEPIWSLDVMDHWAGVRAAAPDYLPLIGPVADATQFKQAMGGLATNSKRWIPSSGAYYPGLYACTGFGSRGLTTIPLGAECLASMINQEPISLPRGLLQAISPARFLCRSIYKFGQPRLKNRIG